MSVVGRTLKIQAPKSALNVKAALGFCTGVCASYTLVDICSHQQQKQHVSFTVSLWIQMWNKVFSDPGSCVRWGRACTRSQDTCSGNCPACCGSDTSRCVHRWAKHTRRCLRTIHKIQPKIKLLNPCHIRRRVESDARTLTGDSINVTELVTTATVALIRAVYVCTLLTAGAGLTFVQICVCVCQRLHETRVRIPTQTQGHFKDFPQIQGYVVLPYKIHCYHCK